MQFFKISQLLDEIIRKISAAILNRLSGVSLICNFCVYALVAWHLYNANLNKAVIWRPTYTPVAQMLLDQSVIRLHICDVTRTRR